MKIVCIDRRERRMRRTRTEYRIWAGTIWAVALLLIAGPWIYGKPDLGAVIVGIALILYGWLHWRHPAIDE
jgi:hypothetical protein